MKRIKSPIILPLVFLSFLFALGDPAVILETNVISQQPEYYHGWPTVARRDNNELWVVWSGGRDGHICPFGQVVAMISRDDGRTWTWPRVLLDTAMDDRDAGVMETAKGTLIVTTFTSSHYASQLNAVLAGKKSSHVREGRLPAWQAAHAWLDAEERKSQLGEWSIRSTDGGKTWSALIPTIVNSPHGPIQLKDGRLLYVGKQLWTKEKKIGVAESRDDGLTWQWLASIPARPGDSIASYHELHAVEAGDGTLIAQIRTHGKNNNRETLQSESADGGRTWTEPHPIGVWGLPSHLLRLRDNRLVMTYGYRRAPFGNQARVSTDNGKTWGDPITISSDGDSSDLGYPSTAELADGTLLTVWYERLKESPRAVLRQAKWKLPPQ
ncbi:sialidase family protein [Ereboglobus luteus]|uniref:Sialidase domain-containing protein n=1 Tax=Ereboglobus luteus TaxID=1796921 RepID=A0A2U8E437_9BACT|nr:sialidase family protein [Ereboglobus luteus]AWI09304.1 hypothetical protein CKA38_08665 [Ereboglobus luteus]